MIELINISLARLLQLILSDWSIERKTP